MMYARLLICMSGRIHSDDIYGRFTAVIHRSSIGTPTHAFVLEDSTQPTGDKDGGVYMVPDTAPPPTKQPERTQSDVHPSDVHPSTDHHQRTHSSRRKIIGRSTVNSTIHGASDRSTERSLHICICICICIHIRHDRHVFQYRSGEEPYTCSQQLRYYSYGGKNSRIHLYAYMHMHMHMHRHMHMHMHSRPPRLTLPLGRRTIQLRPSPSSETRMSTSTSGPHNRHESSFILHPSFSINPT